MSKERLSQNRLFTPLFLTPVLKLPAGLRCPKLPTLDPGRQRYGRCNAKRLVNAHKVVVHHVERNGGGVVLNLFGESIRKASKATHSHSHG
jgi:hypothetical protein